MRSLISFFVLMVCTAAVVAEDVNAIAEEQKRRVQERLAHLQHQQQHADPSALRELIENHIALNDVTVGKPLVKKVTPEIKEKHEEKLRRMRERRNLAEEHERIVKELGLSYGQEHTKKMSHLAEKN